MVRLIMGQDGEDDDDDEVDDDERRKREGLIRITGISPKGLEQNYVTLRRYRQEFLSVPPNKN
jgi:hypothetical protein